MNKLKSNKRLARRYMAIWAAAIVLANVLPATAAAAGTAGGDPLTIVNNLSTFIFSCIKAIGIIVLGWGVVQVGMSVRATTPARELRASCASSAACSLPLQKRSFPPLVRYKRQNASQLGTHSKNKEVSGYQ